ncbi:hypothetical protein B0J13DRAFT_568100 [Dactylonectria estremocensis]|uniref:RING-type domain-containing protein n=1 Tax=Dactylonectria estremocensis TaxID=1079267 RepID=A0A9P9DJ15_9HYPO|nr:hypothetical protein B0J13DRAFT_568100 [Dactylonectria estremocensis]
MSALSRNRVFARNIPTTRSLPLLRLLNRPPLQFSNTLIQSINVESLLETERECPICYNVYGVEDPEGIVETPVALCACKHVFGDHCIKSWLRDGGTCPYCRKLLHGQ